MRILWFSWFFLSWRLMSWEEGQSAFFAFKARYLRAGASPSSNSLMTRGNTVPWAKLVLQKRIQLFSLSLLSAHQSLLFIQLPIFLPLKKKPARFCMTFSWSHNHQKMEEKRNFISTIVDVMYDWVSSSFPFPLMHSAEWLLCYPEI